MGKSTLSTEYKLLWGSQTLSLFGSSLTSFAINIWLYTHNQNVLSLSFSTVIIMLPKMLGGILFSPFIEKADKKKLLLFTDLVSGFTSLILLLLLASKNLNTVSIYFLNIINSVCGSIQLPTNEVVISLLVKKENYSQANGLQSFGNHLCQLIAPAFSAWLITVSNMETIILFDLASLTIALMILLLWVKLPKISIPKQVVTFKWFLEEIKETICQIKQAADVKQLFWFMLFINLLAGMTYYNLITPLILARTKQQPFALSLVEFSASLGGILGSIFVTITPPAKHKLTVIFVGTAFSFLAGDLTLAISRSLGPWCIGIFLSNSLIPLINANENYLWRTRVPKEFHGRAFALKYAFQSGAIPIGILIGGFLADYYFEPYMYRNNHVLSKIFGNQNGSGMALMFLCSGLLGSSVSFISSIYYTKKRALCQLGLMTIKSEVLAK